MVTLMKHNYSSDKISISNFDSFRMEYLKKSFNKKSWLTGLSSRIEKIKNYLGSENDPKKILKIGENLTSLIRDPSKKRGSGSSISENQSMASISGSLWELSNIWYLNLIFYGTNVIAVNKRKDFVPEVISDSITVSINNFNSNSESDILVYSVPSIDHEKDINIKTINKLIEKNKKETRLSIIQCKTNWNENAQIPMLWDVIYNSSIPRVSLGIKGLNPQNFEEFKYAFSTMPSNYQSNKGDYNHKENSISVLRVNGLSGGNYWGYKSKEGIAKGLNEFFNSNFQNSFNSLSIEDHIQKNIENNPKLIEMFLNIGSDT